jgi:peroxiredoxin Q/BCP
MSAFRDLNSRFAGAKAQVLGLSMDDLPTQKRFADSLKLPFPLLADEKGDVTRAYGILDGDAPKRVTFVIGTDGKIQRVLLGKEALDPSGALNACEAHPVQ